MKRIEYNTKQYAFREIICNWFETYDLSKLHFIKDYEHFERENDQSTIWHKTYYEKIRSDKSFDDIYTQFLNDVIKPRYGEEIVYQKIPTFRVHLPGNIAVGEFHKDKYYRDVKWAEKVKETNYYLPLTKAYGTNTIWMESEEGKEDFKGYDVSYGEILVFSGPNLLHGNQTNIEKDSRCSIDFRIVHPDNFKTSDKGSVTANVKFKVGGYFEKL